ncbi:MAG: repeat-containing protein [Chitinophagaceae bacterium]|nr:repeat-containing protein [Chitinophagaceae bacterium]
MQSIEVEKIGMYSGHRDCIYGLLEGIAPQQFFSSGADGLVVAWDMKHPDQGELIAKLTNSVYALALDASTKRLWIGQNFQGVHLIDTVTRKEIKSAAITTSYIFSILFRDGLLYCACGDGALVILDATQLTVIVRWKYSESSARALAFSPDGNHLAIGYSDHTIRIISLSDGTLTTEIQAHENSVFTLAYSPDGRYLLSGSRDARLKVWNVNAGYALQQSIVAHMYAINDIAYSPDGRYFVTCSMDKSIKIWDAKVFRLLKVIDKARHAGHGTSVNKVLWTKYNGYIVSGSDDRKVSIWNLNFIATEISDE